MTPTRWLQTGAGMALGALVAGLGTSVGSSSEAQAAPGSRPPGESSAVTVAARVGSGDGSELPLGGRRVFDDRILVAYYGTGGTGALGVLGEDTPDRITRRLREVARPFGADGDRVQIVYELIVTVADASPGADGDYSHDVARSYVEEFIRAAERHRALLVLDLQPGRSDFLTVAKRWRWALRHPWVGLALDPEWRMAPGEVPGQTVGQVSAREVNQVSRWLSDLAVRRDHPQKVFIVHQFREDMVIGLDNVRRRRRLALVQHVDGFGTRSQKLATYHRVRRADRFAMGFKLFYDEDQGLMTPSRVLGIRPRVRFVSYQ